MNTDEADTGPYPGTTAKDSADIAEILADPDLSITRERIRVSRENEPCNPARALRLLDLVGLVRPVQGLIEDAAQFDDRDTAQILGVAALERPIAEAMDIMLADAPEEPIGDVVRTFARQRRTNHVAHLIKLLKRVEPERRTKAAKIIKEVLNEFAVGDAGHGRPSRDIQLVHVHLMADQYRAEANGLLDLVFREERPGFAVALDDDFAHDAPHNTVLDDWALAMVKGEELYPRVIRVVGELLWGGRRTERLIATIGDHWPATALAQQCADLVDRDCRDACDAIRTRAVRRDKLRDVAQVIHAWWRHPQLNGYREALLDDAVNTLTPARVATLADCVNEEFNSRDTADLLRLRAALGVDGRGGADLAELLGALDESARRKAGSQVARRLASAAKASTVPPATVAGYIRALRKDSMSGSRQAADDARDALTSIATSDPSVVACVGENLIQDDATKDDALVILRRYLTNHAVAAPEDVVAVFRVLDRAGQSDVVREGVTDLAEITVGRWPPVRRREAAHALRDAGLPERAEQVTPN